MPSTPPPSATRRRRPALTALLAAALPLALTSCADNAPNEDPKSTSEQAAATTADAPDAPASSGDAPTPDAEQELPPISEDGYRGEYRAGTRNIPEKPENAVRLAAYNILNLFDDDDDPNLSGDVDDMFSRRDSIRAKPEDQRAAAAQAIREINPDIIAFQEVESLQALTEFRDQFLEGMGYDYIASEDVGYGRGVEQSVLSRFPITNTTIWPGKLLEGFHPDDPSRMSPWDRDSAGQQIRFRRSPLFVEIAIPAADGEGDYQLGLMNIHHKSGRDNDYWRLAEAKTITSLINDIQDANPNLNIAALGDFNDVPNEEHVMLYETAAGMTDAARQMNTMRGSETFTHASRRTIDAIKLSRTMLPELVEDSYFVYATPLRPSDLDWRTTPTPTGYASDHMPVVIDFMPIDR